MLVQFVGYAWRAGCSPAVLGSEALAGDNCLRL
jgi:hypothetical protein